MFKRRQEHGCIFFFSLDGGLQSSIGTQEVLIIKLGIKLNKI